MISHHKHPYTTHITHNAHTHAHTQFSRLADHVTPAASLHILVVRGHLCPLLVPQPCHDRRGLLPGGHLPNVQDGRASVGCGLLRTVRNTSLF